MRRPSQLYSFSFAPNPDWTRSFSPQPEIQAYLERTAREAGVLDRFRFGVTVEDAAWDEAEQVWHVGTDHGEVVADIVVTGSGGLSEPRLPEIAGIDSFGGEIFHSARWNHDYDLTGKRVAVIGTGASAIQIVPEIAKQVAHLDVYQRTAPWVMPRNDRDYTARRAVRASGTFRSCRGPTAPASTGGVSASCRASPSTRSWLRRPGSSR